MGAIEVLHPPNTGVFTLSETTANYGPSLDIEHLTRIAVGDVINGDKDDSDSGHYGYAVLRDIRAGDTITAAAYEDTLDYC
ncbi:hypothetical protein [Halorussus pelagicus]|uniref:hypothetical protein n=1 Tax=Halorussus pelagicus TaxID=2505977 RepID=UPI000FFC0EE0|nr:hypothetical protein [Halorussus pelagicus]